MRLSLFFYCSILFASFLVPVKSFAQTDTAFWFVAPENSIGNFAQLDRPIYLRISSFSSPATVILSQPANPTFAPITLSLNANSSASIDLTPRIDSIENKPPDHILNRGLYIRATNIISVYYEIVGGTACNVCNPELFALKGSNALGTNFFTPFQQKYDNGNYSPLPYSAFDIVATNDLTSVTITPTQDIVGHAAGTPFTVILNRGQTFNCKATSQAGAKHPSGSVIVSDKPVAVTVDDDLVNIGGQDIEGDQLIPVDKTGTEYIVVAGPNTTKDLAIIVGTQDNTQINVDGSLVTTINTGETYQYALNTSKAIYINSSNPVYVYQLTTALDEAGGAILPPITCTGSTVISITRSIANPFNVFLITKTGNEGNFLYNGKTGIVLPSAFAPVPGTSGTWQFALIDLSNTAKVDSAIRISNTSGLFSMGLLQGISGGSSYGYFSDFSLHNSSTKKNFCLGSPGKLKASVQTATHLWSDGSTADTLMVSTDGTYWVQNVLNGCTLTDTFAVNFSTIPVIATGPDTAICKRGSVQLLAAGNGNFFWAPSKGLSDTTIANPVARPTVTTTYIVSNNLYLCAVAKDTVVVTVNNPPAIVYLTQDTTICKGNSIPLLVNTNTDYAWSPHAGLSCTGCQMPVASPDTTTTYYITLTNKGCASTDSVIIGVKNIPFDALGDTTICKGGAAQLNATPDDSYSWAPATGLNNNTIANPVATPLINTTYTLTANGYCGIQRDEVRVFVNGNPSVTVSGNTAICKGDSTSITIFGNNFAYQWAPSSGLSCPTCSSTKASPLLTTTYFITATDRGCSTTDTIIVTVVNPSQFVATGDTAICKGQTTQLNASAGYSYKWVPATGLNSNTIGNPLAASENSITYTVTGSNVCGTQHDSVKITIEDYPVVTITADTGICKGKSVDLVASGGTNYQWSPAGGLSNALSPNPTATPDSSVTYTVSVTDFPACITTATVAVNVIPYPVITLAPEASEVCGENIQLTPVILHVTSYHWKAGMALADTTQLSPIVNPEASTTYTIVASNQGCESTASIAVTLLDGYINLPTAFSPNKDGHNDIYHLLYSCEFSLDYFRVYDRWGQLVFETNNLTKGWDGTYNGKEAQIGVYQYAVSGTNKLGKKVFLKGNVTLLR